MAYPTYRAPISLRLDGPTPRDVWAIVIVLFTSFSLAAFESTERLIAVLRLSEAAWQRGFLWQVLTYPSAPYFASPFFFLLSLYFVFTFARELLNRLHRRRFWRMFALATVAGAIVALATQAALKFLNLAPQIAPTFFPLQGHQTVLVIMVTAFAVLFADATILLFFVLPIPARAFIPIEILLAFVGFLVTKDFASFLGTCAVIAGVVFFLRGQSRRSGSLWRDLRARYERWRVRRRARKWQKKHGIRLVEPPSDPRWLN